MCFNSYADSRFQVMIMKDDDTDGDGTWLWKRDIQGKSAREEEGAEVKRFEV
jgi:hypothetical protein